MISVASTLTLFRSIVRGKTGSFMYPGIIELHSCVIAHFLSNHGRVKAFEQFAGFVLQRSDLIEAYLQRVVGQRD